MKKKSWREKEKQIREEEIIGAAEKLFSKHGYAYVSMDKIAEEAEFTKRTLYQYFQDKDDLFYAVVHKGFVQLASYCRDAFINGKNGFDKIRLSFEAYYKFHRDFPDAFKLMNQMGVIKKRQTPRQEQFKQFNIRMFTAIGKVIEEGQKDGSIRKDIEPYESAYVMAFITTGFFHQLADTGENFTKNLKLDPDKFTRLAVMLLSDVLKPH